MTTSCLSRFFVVLLSCVSRVFVQPFYRKFSVSSCPVSFSLSIQWFDSKQWSGVLTLPFYYCFPYRRLCDILECQEWVCWPDRGPRLVTHPHENLCALLLTCFYDLNPTNKSSRSPPRTHLKILLSSIHTPLLPPLIAPQCHTSPISALFHWRDSPRRRLGWPYRRSGCTVRPFAFSDRRSESSGRRFEWSRHRSEPWSGPSDRQFASSPRRHA